MLCRLCGKEKQHGTEVFKDKAKGAVLISIMNKYLTKEVIHISASDALSKYVCTECERKICAFDEFCLMVANVQKQLTAPALEIDFAEDVLRRLKESDIVEKSLEGDAKARKHACRTCGKRFRCQAHLIRHEYVHSGLRPYACDICSMSFNQQEILRKHKERHEGKKHFQCADCLQSFRHKVSLKSHLINFHADAHRSAAGDRTASTCGRTLACHECGKLFATRYKLQRHARCHTGERPFRCGYCERAFSQTGNLKLHQIKCRQTTTTTTAAAAYPLSDAGQQQQQQQRAAAGALDNFQSVYITESEIQKTINETINSSDPNSSYLSKPYENQIYIDEEIETMLDQDLGQLERDKYQTPSPEKISLCLKRPETPELLHSLLYDDD